MCPMVVVSSGSLPSYTQVSRALKKRPGWKPPGLLPGCYAPHPTSLVCKGFAGGVRAATGDCPFLTVDLDLHCFFSRQCLPLHLSSMTCEGLGTPCRQPGDSISGTGVGSLGLLRNGDSGLNYLVEILVSLLVLSGNGFQEPPFSFFSPG